MREDVMREGGTLPQGWVRTTLGEAATIMDSQRVPINADEREQRIANKEPHEVYPYFGATGQVGWIDSYLFDEELVLLGEDGAPFLDPGKGKAYIIKGRTWVNNHAHVLKAKGGLTLNSYLMHFLNLFDYHGYVTGTTRFKLNQSEMRKIPIPLAPLPQQRRIVAKIEELFTQLDAGVAALKRVQANLKRYRVSVLKAACEGRLAPQDPSDEPADRLLARILVERRAKWEAEHPGKKYVEPAAPETEGLPEGWCWASVEQIGEVTGGLTKNQKRDALPTRLPYLRVANVYANELRLDDLLTIGVEASEIKRVLLQDGDLLVVEGNGSADQIGRVAIWRDAVSPCIHLNHIIKVRFDPVDLGPFILYWLLSDGGRDQITQVASSTSGLYTLSLSKVAMLLIPVPPRSEQHRIVAEVERRLSVVAELEATVAANLARAGRLRQAVLKRAFEGRLVAQETSGAV